MNHLSNLVTPLILGVALYSTAASHAKEAIFVDCSRGESLQGAVSFAFPNTTILVKGLCRGPVTIKTDGLQIHGAATPSSAGVNGAGKDVITVSGAQRVLLKGLSVTGGANGIVAEKNAQVTIQDDLVSGNALTGILVQSNSSVTVTGGSSTANGFDGSDVESTSSLVVTGSYSLTGNGVFGIDVNNGSSLTLSAAKLSVSGNTLGIQLGTVASGFEDGQSTLNASNNLTVGLTMVSGSHMVDFGGAIIADNNGNNGISLNSKSGLDLDAAAQVESNNNAIDGVHLEQLSVMTIFNNPQFSGATGTTTLAVHGNQGDGVSLLTGSEMLIDNFAALQSTGNVQAGVAVDDGSSLSFGQTVPVTGVFSAITGNHPDLSLSFGSRLTTLPNDTLGIVTCDATVLVRGPAMGACPHH